MNVEEMFFVFHHPVSLRGAVRGVDSWRCILGHVEMYGCTGDETWVTFDPRGSGFDLRALHRYDDVIDMIASKRAVAMVIVRFPRSLVRQYRAPIFPPANCAVACAALAGVRAFTPAGLLKSLVRRGGQVILDRRAYAPPVSSENVPPCLEADDETTNPEGRSSRQGRAAA